VSLLVLGAGGQVGRALIERAGSRATGADRAACDICDADAVAHAMSAEGIAVVVNCAGFTAVDRAEGEREQAYAVNAKGAAIVARAAAARSLPLIQLSTDYVYAGNCIDAHSEDNPIAPVNVYGSSKAEGDVAVASENPAHLVLRVSWVFGVYGSNFVKTMLRLGRERSELSIVDDQTGGPTEASDIADAVLTMAAACLKPTFDAWGVYHFSGSPSTTWYGFAQAVFERTKMPSPHVVPISSSEYPTPARRPANSVLDCGKIQRVFAVAQPDWRIGLSRVLKALGELRE
jgi:dTDP-4-dehydrorhamnose reductase